MNEDCLQEIQGIREAQRDLRARMWALDGRIDNVGQQLAKAVTKAAPQAMTDAPPIVEKKAEAVSITPPALPQIAPLDLRSAKISPSTPATPILGEADKAGKSQSVPKPRWDDLENSELLLAKEELPKPPAPERPRTEAAPRASEPEEKGGFEMEVGRVWLVRLGIMILLTGLVFLGNYAWTEIIGKLGPFGKLVMIYLAGGTLASLGWWVKRKHEELSAYGKVLIGGGIATAYYATYAAHFVEPLRVITSPLIGGVALMAVAGGIIWLANRMHSEAVAVVTVLLGFYTAAINPIAGFSLFSNLVLSAIAIILLLRRQWLSISFLSMIGCYAAFAFWSYQQTGSLLITSASNPSTFWTALLFPACYWLTFTVATFVARSDTFPEGTRPVFLTLNNGGFFGLTAPLIATTYPQQFWIFALAYGVVLLSLAWLAARKDASESAFDGAYLTQGLGLLSLGLLFKFSGYQLAIILALQSITLLRFSRFRHGVILQIFSGLSAVGASYISLDALMTDSPHSTLTGIAVAAILIGAAWLFKAQRRLAGTVSFQYRAAGYVALGLLVSGATVLYGAPQGQMLYWFAGLAALFTASIYVLRMPEITYGAQAFALAATAAWLIEAAKSNINMAPLLTTVALLGALMHWWSRQRIVVMAASYRISTEAFYALGITGVLMLWTLIRFPGKEILLALPVGALCLLAHAFTTRAWPLAISSQFFSLATILAMVLDLSEPGSWWQITASLAILASQALLIEACAHRAPANAIEHIHTYAQMLRVAALLIGLGIVQVYVPEPWPFLVFSVLAFGLFVIGIRRAPGELLAGAALASVMAAWHFIPRNLFGGELRPTDLIGLGLILLAQQIGKRSSRAAFVCNSHLQGLLIILGLLGLWLVTGRWVATVQSGFLLTVAWSVFALLVFSAGVALRERLYRWIALGVLALAIGRLFLFDVWQLDTIFRILSFLVLGAVLLVLGFLYNRLAELIRKWM